MIWRGCKGGLSVLVLSVLVRSVVFVINVEVVRISSVVKGGFGDCLGDEVIFVCWINLGGGDNVCGR